MLSVLFLARLSIEIKIRLIWLSLELWIDFFLRQLYLDLPIRRVNCCLLFSLTDQTSKIARAREPFYKFNMYQSNDIKHFTLLALTVVVISCIPLISGHVALTYPPARKYDLDFLDNTRTKGPCGMPKGKHHHHTIQWNSNFFSLHLYLSLSSTDNNHFIFLFICRPNPREICFSINCFQ